MNKVCSIMTQQASFKDMSIALLMMRIGVAGVLVGGGYEKLMSGTQQWASLGAAMGNLGITFLPVMWGFLAACAEFFGSIGLFVGLCSRLSSFFLAFVMFVATLMHVMEGDIFSHYAYPFSLMITLIGLTIMGGGKYSLDYYMCNKR